MKLMFNPSWLSVLLVALGGALGSVLRFKLVSWISHQAKTNEWLSSWAQAIHLSHAWFLGTLAVNMLGCALVGLLLGVSDALMKEPQLFSAEWRLFLFVGIAGGFTTFSAFGLETFQLLRQGEVWVAVGYVGASVVLGLMVLALGWWSATATLGFFANPKGQ